MAVLKKGGLVGCSKEEQVQGRGQGRVGLAVGGGARACGGVGGRGTGPRNGAKCRILKRRKLAFGGMQGLRFRGGKWWGTGPRDGANFATCVVFLLFLTRTKRRKMAFFEGCLVGWGGVPTGAGLVDGG